MKHQITKSPKQIMQIQEPTAFDSELKTPSRPT
jgi:hypothetical protein